MPLGQAAGEIDSTRRSLAQLDLTEVEQLRAERAKLELLIAGHDAEITAVNKEITLASQRITDAQGAIERINGGRDARFREPSHIFGDRFVRTVLDALNGRYITLAKASRYLDGLKINDLHQLERFYAGV